MCGWVLWPGGVTKDLGKSFFISNMNLLHPFGLHVGLPPGFLQLLTDIPYTDTILVLWVRSDGKGEGMEMVLEKIGLQMGVNKVMMTMAWKTRGG